MPKVLKSIVDDDGPAPVNVDNLQLEREKVAEAGLAHQSFEGKRAATPEDVKPKKTKK